MKMLIVLAALVAVASAGRSYGGNSYGAGSGASYGASSGASYGGQLSTGTSSQFRSEDNYGNYNFGYDESHSSGSTSRREEQQNGVRRGSYSLSDADGRQRTVSYIADDYGFRATVQSNEPGVDSKDPADVLINKNGGSAGYAAPVSTTSYSAPAPLAVASYSAPAPLAVSSYSAPVAARSYSAAAPRYAAPVAVSSYSSAPVASYGAQQADSYGSQQVASYGQQETYEAQTPRAFSYSFNNNHMAPVATSYAAAPVATGYAQAGPVFQQRQDY